MISKEISAHADIDNSMIYTYIYVVKLELFTYQIQSTIR